MPSDTENTTLLRPIRARGHRSYLTSEFGAPGAGDGEPEGLTMAQILENPKLAELGLTVFEQVQAQLDGGSGQDGSKHGTGRDDEAETAAYRARLVFWADLLESFLEETLADLDRLNAVDRSA